MSKKATKYSTQFKTKLVLEILKGENTLNEIASKYNVIPKNLQNWKRIFLENAEVAMEPAKAVREYKEEITKLEAKNDEYAKKVGKLTVELEWTTKKLNSLDLSNKKDLVESKLNKYQLQDNVNYYHLIGQIYIINKQLIKQTNK